MSKQCLGTQILAERLQLKIEGLDNVERVYVHVSHEMKEFYGGKVERALLNKSLDLKKKSYMGKVKTMSRSSFAKISSMVFPPDVEKGKDSLSTQASNRQRGRG
jgi:hypothetical protein